MQRTLKDIFILTLVDLAITFLIWLPHILSLPSFYNLNFSQGFSTIYRNFDGLEYVVIAKTFYVPALIRQIPQSLSPSYYPSHFPLFPIFIALFAPFLGYLKSMLFVSVLSTILSSLAFYLLLKKFDLTSQPLWLSVVFLLLPARWVIVHSVGSPEPMFIFFSLLSLYFFKIFEDSKKQRFLWLASLSIALTQLTRPPGILLFAAIGVYLLYKTFRKNRNISSLFGLIQYYPLALAPLALLGVFLWFQITTGNFFAYFHSGDNIHLTFPPFQVFNKHQFWVGDIWLENIIYIFLLGVLGGLQLLKSPLEPAGFFVLIYLLATSFVVHRDISRYALPVMPFAIIAFEKILVKREFKIAMAFLALAIYLYSQNFILANIAPIANLGYFN